jgi:hypothetical protein
MNNRWLQLASCLCLIILLLIGAMSSQPSATPTPFHTPTTYGYPPR